MNERNVIERQWLILTYIPRYPQFTTVSKLVKLLSHDGVICNARMIQRDLNSLSSMHIFPLSYDTKGRTQCWFWPKDGRLFNTSMTPSYAIAIVIAGAYLKHLLPIHLADEIEGYLQSAEFSLSKAFQKNNEWRNKIAVVSPGPLFKSKILISEEKLAALYESLFLNRSLSVFYKPRDGNLSAYKLNPLGLVSKSQAIYLVALDKKDNKIKQFHLSRFHDVEMLQDSFNPPSDFDLKCYVNERQAFHYVEEDSEIKLDLLVSNSFLYFFETTELGGDQVISPFNELDSKLTVTVKWSSELKWWLIGQSRFITVISPPEQAQEIKELLLDAINKYK